MYLQKDPEDANSKEREQRKIVGDNSIELKELVNRMQTYKSNILGSNAYFYGERRGLETLMDQEDPCTTWYTLSVADNHWIDLHRLLDGKCEVPDIFNPIENVREKKYDLQVSVYSPFVFL